MDSVRFGRVLGIGTRLAAKTVANAVDAAMAPNPSGSQGAESASGASAAAARGQAAAHAVGQAKVQARQAQQGLAEGGRRMGGTVKRLSGVLWLEFTGAFFGLFALSAASAVWKLRGEWRAPGQGHLHLIFAIVMTVVFGYFCVSSFVRAQRRGQAK